MLVIDDRPSQPLQVALSSLSVGAAFSISQTPNPVMKTDFVQSPSGKLGCTDLFTGQLALIDPAALVTPLNAEVHIKT